MDRNKFLTLQMCEAARYYNALFFLRASAPLRLNCFV